MIGALLGSVGGSLVNGLMGGGDKGGGMLQGLGDTAGKLLDPLGIFGGKHHHGRKRHHKPDDMQEMMKMMMEMMKELLSMLKSQNGEESRGKGCHGASVAAGQPIDIKGGSGDDTVIVCNSSDHARTH